MKVFYSVILRWQYTYVSGECIKPVRVLHSTAEAATKHAEDAAAKFEALELGAHAVDPATRQITVLDYELAEE